MILKQRRAIIFTVGPDRAIFKRRSERRTAEKNSVAQKLLKYYQLFLPTDQSLQIVKPHKTAY
jgi:hypothetical protein